MAEATQTESLKAVEGIIERQVLRRDELKKQLKDVNDSLRSILENSSDYSQLTEAAKIGAKKVQEQKATLMKSAEAMQLKVKARELRENIKDITESLGNHCRSYEAQTGQLILDLGKNQPLFEITKTYRIRRSR